MKKTIKLRITTILIASTMFLTSCDVMLGVLGGMAMGMASYNSYSYSPSYGASTNNNYLLDPNYAVWQTQQKQAQYNAINQQLINQTVQQVKQQEEEEYMRMTGGKISREEWNAIKAQAAWNDAHETNHNYNDSGSGSSSSNTPTNSNVNTSSNHKCSRCNGAGRVAINTNPPQFGGVDYKVKCNECGREYLKSWGHTHITCPQCHGKCSF